MERRDDVEDEGRRKFRCVGMTTRCLARKVTMRRAPLARKVTMRRAPLARGVTMCSFGTFTR